MKKQKPSDIIFEKALEEETIKKTVAMIQSCKPEEIIIPLTSLIFSLLDYLDSNLEKRPKRKGLKKSSKVKTKK